MCMLSSLYDVVDIIYVLRPINESLVSGEKYSIRVVVHSSVLMTN